MTTRINIAENEPVPRLPKKELNAMLDILERKCVKEKSAREQAETILRLKSRELNEKNYELKRMNDHLEKIVQVRTSDLRTALKNVQEQKQRTEHIALHDVLTGLPNRRYLRMYLDEAFKNAKRMNEYIAALHIDLDRFKLINDTLGHAAGDHVLVTVGKILKEVTTNQDFIARIGGDEFIIVARFKSDPTYVRRLARKIPIRAARPIDYMGRQMRIGASVGFSYDKAFRTAPDKLLISSDIALYEAKDLGRGLAQEFTKELEVQMNEKKQLADEILEGLEKEQFVPAYQPKICSKTKKIEGVEALVRWNHPTNGIIHPEAFLKVASDIGVLAKIDEVMLKNAIADFREWEKQKIDIPRFSVNISLGRLLEEDLLKRLDQLELPKGRIVFEVVESIFFEKPDKAINDRINAIKQRGIDIEINNFGTGHASITSVIQLQPGGLKIDRQLIKNIVTSPIQQKLVKAIVEIGKSLKLSVTAEGIETRQHAKICSDLGCDILQGYYFGKPMTKNDVTEFARNFTSATNL